MADLPRYSREDMADAVGEMVHQADLGMGGFDKRNALISTDRLRKWAAMLSEAANRAPTHAELVAMIEARRECPHWERGEECVCDPPCDLDRPPDGAEIEDPLCPEHDIPCTWGCEMDCFLADCTEEEVQAAIANTHPEKPGAPQHDGPSTTSAPAEGASDERGSGR